MPKYQSVLYYCVFFLSNSYMVSKILKQVVLSLASIFNFQFSPFNFEPTLLQAILFRMSCLIYMTIRTILKSKKFIVRASWITIFNPKFGRFFAEPFGSHCFIRNANFHPPILYSCVQLDWIF